MTMHKRRLTAKQLNESVGRLHEPASRGLIAYRAALDEDSDQAGERIRRMVVPGADAYRCESRLIAIPSSSSAKASNNPALKLSFIYSKERKQYLEQYSPVPNVKKNEEERIVHHLFNEAVRNQERKRQYLHRMYRKVGKGVK
mmetsp:Transcript_1949/g.4002  ORF Transcript_1949/g.4002 Transcript_1949/m.4002 type:complete len:143 (-) Transcript_1949:239-667(-)